MTRRVKKRRASRGGKTPVRNAAGAERRFERLRKSMAREPALPKRAKRAPRDVPSEPFED